MMVNEYAALWSRCTPNVVDVRHLKLAPGECIRSYKLPSMMFFLNIRGSAHLHLNGTHSTLNGFLLMHGNKGHVLQIDNVQQEIECYLIYYKPSVKASLEGNGADLAFAFEPRNPLVLLDRMEQFLRVWQTKGEEAAHLLSVRAQYYAWTVEVLRQLQDWQERLAKPDIVEGAKVYIHQHFARSITLEEIAEALNYSVPHLSKQFKQRVGRSPIEYLIGVRIDKAQEWLTKSDATLQEVAAAVGYTDISYFTKSFKKHTGLTPGQFKAYVKNIDKRLDRHKNPIASPIVERDRSNYNLNNNENDYHLDRIEGENEEMLRLAAKSKLAMVMLGLTFILGACSGASSGTNGSQPAGTSEAVNKPTNGESGTTEQSAKWPRTYKDGTGKEVVIEKQPERVVTGHFAMMEYFFALGTPPIASPLSESILAKFATLKPYVGQAKVADIGQVRTPNLELMIELDPDLIVAFAGTHNDVFEDINKISTVVMMDNTEWDWKKTLREYAFLLGKEEVAETYITKLDGLMKEARDKLQVHKDKTATFLRPTGNGNTFYVLDDNSVSYMYDAQNGLGLTAPGEYRLEEEIVSLEGIVTLNPDVIFIVDYLDDIDTQLAELQKSNVWKSLKAVQGENVFPLDVSIDTGGPLAIQHATEQVLHFMSK
ncbi:ABC transporter substrate-binding protein [Paenibacillus sp. SC116]|uniref:AraC family transcriptional regulator n=1 Tax=Paenibacillus sp. SC116 TaxID=2968986 RepID=UPI00215AA1A5|nr:ABC transporter substrate-binding protein [Paenibacillus sp. SC116]MCR8843558.1 ABC transporter substrate-binding protein [Paenibacillus sp. SC116]